MNKTAQREAIIQELRKMRNHPTADELYDVLRTKLPQISLGTIYRNLEQMVQMGMIRKLELTGRQKRFDGDLSEHYHMRCRYCDRILNIPQEELSGLDKELVLLRNRLQLEGFILELVGRCPYCAEAMSKMQEESVPDEEQEECTAGTTAQAL
ncbi:MAG: transcriptional repressor [Victivallaceae bacterium]|nr:transcriptional repressor [Victivallaceae bacterium]